MTKYTPSLANTTGLLIGWTGDNKDAGMGFPLGLERAAAQDSGTPITYDGEGHLMTIAPTGAGKGVGCVVPAILRHDGPVVVMDLKGENYAMTRRHRSERGSRVICIDPFGIVDRISSADTAARTEEIGGLNPFDLLPYLSDDRDTACRALAEMLVSPNGHSADPFWRDAAIGVIAALIECYDGFGEPMRSLTAMVQDLGLEVPEAKHPGDIPGSLDAISRIHADVELTTQMEEIGLTPGQAWSCFNRAGGSGARRPSPFELHELLFDASMRAFAVAREDLSESERRELAGSIADQSLDPENAFERFCTLIPMPESFEGDAHALLGRLWGLLLDLSDDLDHFCPEGSFAHSASDMGVPENYPLAIHRLARHESPMCRSAAAQPMTADRTWGSILCTMRAELAQFTGRSVSRTLGGAPAIDLEALRRGEDVSLYIAFPPGRIRSHRNLFRVMVEGLLAVIVSRTRRPARKTLMLLDEVAQLGRIELLITAKTLLRGYGVQVWSFWQDITQLKSNYQNDWQTILNNCRVVQVFGRGMGVMANDLSQALDVGPDRISALADGDLLAWVDSGTPQVLRRPVCYADEGLAELCDDGPFARPTKEQEPPLRRWCRPARGIFQRDYPADTSASKSCVYGFMI